MIGKFVQFQLNIYTVNHNKMRLLISGYREFADYKLFCETLEEFNGTISVIIHGGCRGADTLARKYAEERGIEQEVYLPNWERYGKRAGPIRNEKMIVDGCPDYAIVFLSEKSIGTKNMVSLCEKHGIDLTVVEI